jgi:glycosyltransferase involved in cell wall biosynthesis
VFDEVAGGAAIMADPHNPTEWADRVQELLDQPELARKLRTAGLAQAASFSRERTAEAFRAALAQEP